MRREQGKLRFEKKFRSGDPTWLETLIVIVLAILVIALALGLPIWLFLAAVAAFVANALGYSPWLGVAVVGILFVLRKALR